MEHIARHQVAPDEVEEVCQGRPMASISYQERIRLVGPTDAGRMLTVILADEGEGIFYVITARPGSRRERRQYQDLMEDGIT